MSNKVQQKLYSFEAPPPAGVWQKLEEALNTPRALQQKLVLFQEPPPPAVWNKIAAALEKDMGQAEPVIRRPFQILKYAAAAAIIIIVAISIVWINNRQTKTNEVVKVDHKTAPAPEAGLPVQPTEDSAPQINNPSDAVVGTNQENEKVIAAGSEKTKRATAKNTLNRTATIAHRTKPATSIKNAPGPEDNEEKYLIYSTASGNVVKVPRKVYALFSCTVDPDMAQAHWCRQRIQLLQEKVAQTASPSTDFAAMLYMLKNLQENQ